MDCIFCKLAESPPPSSTYLDTPYLLGILDIQPLVAATDGGAHLLLIPKRHAATLDCVDIESAQHLGSALVAVVRALKDTVISLSPHLDPSQVAINVVQNNGAGAGQVVDHVHFHIVLRSNDPQTSLVTNAVRNKKTDWSSFNTRTAYYSQVYARGQRTDLDDEEMWNQQVLAGLKQVLHSLKSSI